MGKSFALQSLAWETGLQAVRDSIRFDTFESFSQHLRDGIRQNSQVTRARYSNLIIKRLFPERRLEGLNPRAWSVYQDETILLDLARVTTLEAEPVIAKFVVEQILTIPPGSVIEMATIRDYIGAVYGSFKLPSSNRLKAAIQHMGFVSRVSGKYIVRALPRPANALLILLHVRLAPTPRIVRLSDILCSPTVDDTGSTVYPFWRLLGIRDESEVRSILRDAESAGLIAKYAIVDQLEQITTRYSLEEYFSEMHRL